MSRVSWPLLTLQSNCFVLPVLSVMAVSPPKMKPGGSCSAKSWVVSPTLCPAQLITRQGCSQGRKTLCLRPDQLFHMTVFRPVSLGRSALAVPRHWQAFAWVASSGPCHSLLLIILVPFGSLCAKPRPLKRTGCRDILCQTCLLTHSPGSMGWPMQDCSDWVKQLPELFSLCMQIAQERHKKPAPLQHPFLSLLSSPRGTRVAVFSHFPLSLVSPSCHVSADFVFL